MKKLFMEEMCDLAGVPFEPTPDMELVAEIPTLGEQEGENDTDSVIKALRDTDYRDKEAFFKLAQLLKGLAAASDSDKKAKEYLSAVSDALTAVAKQVLREGVEEAVEFDTRMRRAIESALDQLKTLGTRRDDPDARKAEDNVIVGLQRMVKDDPVKFLYSFLEVVGVRGKHKGKYA